MGEHTTRKDLHIRVDSEVYEKLRQIVFYEQRTFTDVVNRLLIEYVEEKAIDEPDYATPPVL